MRSGAKGVIGWGRWLILLSVGLVGLLWLLTTGVTSGEKPNLLRQAIPLGSENTWFQVQNIGNKAANLVVDYYSSGGFLVTQESSTTLPSGHSRQFSQATNPNLPSGFGGSAIAAADAPIRTLLVKDIDRNGGKSYGGDNTPARGYNKQHLPLIYSNAGAWNTRLVVQNAGNTGACVRLIYRSNDGDVAFTDPEPDSQPFTGCPNGGISLAPRSSLERDQSEMTGDLPQPFTGSLVIETVASGSTPASQQFIVATADVWRSDNRSFATYEGVGQNLSDLGEMSTTVFLPIVQKHQGPQQGWSTGYQVSTADPSQLAKVTATYCCDPRLPNDGKLTKSFAVQSSTFVHQDAEEELPDDFNGAVTLTSDQPISGVVIRRWKDDSAESITGYTGVPGSSAGTTIWLPLLYRNVDFNWQSSFQIQVADGGSANVEVTYYGNQLPDGSVSFSQTVNGVGLFEQIGDTHLPNGFIGAAVVRADKPIAGSVILYSDYFAGDDAMAYAAYGIPLVATTPSPTESVTPTPTPSGNPINVNLFANWNLVQWFPSSCRSSDTAFANLVASGMLRVAWEFQPSSQSWTGYDPNVPGPVNTLTELCAEDIVWLNVADASVWSQEP